MDEIFRNFLRLKRLLAHAFRTLCRRMDIDVQQAVALKALRELGPCSAIDLCRATGSDPASVNRTVAELVRRGWVHQERDASDRRRCRLTLTPATGDPLAREVARSYRRLLRQAVRPFEPAERRRIGKDLARLADRMEGLAGPPPVGSALRTLGRREPVRVGAQGPSRSPRNWEESNRVPA